MNLSQHGGMPALILDAARTPFGRYRGNLSAMRVDDLAALPIIELLRRHASQLDPGRIDDVLYGNTNGAGEENRQIARSAALLSGLPPTVPGMTLNRLSISGGEAFVQARRTIATGEADLLVVGGVEGMSRAPFVLSRPDHALPDQLSVLPTGTDIRLQHPEFRPEWTMSLGIAAEEVAIKQQITRSELDAFTVRSHRRAAAAWDAGVHEGFVFPVSVATSSFKKNVVRRDDLIRTELTEQKLAELETIFSEAGPVTNGNSAPFADGAVAALVGSQAAALELGITPLGELIGSTLVAAEPHRVTLAPATAIQRLLLRLGLRADQIDLWEIDEPFAAIPLTVMHMLPDIDPERVNVHGGALAYGHPLSASLPRVIVDLCRHLSHRGGGIGIATTCTGGGQAIAIAVRN